MRKNKVFRDNWSQASGALYTKIQTLCKKQDNLRYVFIHKKPHTFRYAIFHDFFKLEFIYKQKACHFALREVFIYKSTTLRKKQDNLRYVFCQ